MTEKRRAALLGEGKKAKASENAAGWRAVIGRHSAMMALEPRFMFDGAVAATADAIADHADAAQDAGDMAAPDAASAPESAAAADEGGLGIERASADLLDSAGDPNRFLAPMQTGGLLMGLMGAGDLPTIDGVGDTLEGVEDVAFDIPGLIVGHWNGDTLVITLRAEHGKISLDTSDAGAVNFPGYAGGWVSEIVLDAAPADLNPVLATLRYRGDQDANGIDADTLTITAAERDNPGVFFTREVSIDLEAVNDVPVLTSPHEWLPRFPKM